MDELHPLHAESERLRRKIMPIMPGIDTQYGKPPSVKAAHAALNNIIARPWLAETDVDNAISAEGSASK